MELPDSSFRDFYDQIDSNLRRIKLCTHVIEDVRENLLDPVFPKDRASLLIATENLTEEVFELLAEVRGIVWDDMKIPPSDLS